jgi:hypothetical protein
VRGAIILEKILVVAFHILRSEKPVEGGRHRPVDPAAVTDGSRPEINSVSRVDAHESASTDRPDGEFVQGSANRIKVETDSPVAKPYHGDRPPCDQRVYRSGRFQIEALPKLLFCQPLRGVFAC